MIKSKVKRQKAKGQLKSKNFNFRLLLFTFYFLLLPLMCFAQPISSTELINNAKQYNGKIVAYEGEVIGDIMARGDHAWVNINDGVNAIGIWIEEALTKDILYTGSYKSKGDRIEVVGVFQQVCLEHGGDLDIHCQSMRKIAPGRVVVERLNTSKKNLIFVLLVILCLIWILRRLKAK